MLENHEQSGKQGRIHYFLGKAEHIHVYSRRYQSNKEGTNLNLFPKGISCPQSWRQPHSALLNSAFGNEDHLSWYWQDGDPYAVVENDRSKNSPNSKSSLIYVKRRTGYLIFLCFQSIVRMYPIFIFLEVRLIPQSGHILGNALLVTNHAR